MNKTHLEAQGKDKIAWMMIYIGAILAIFSTNVNAVIWSNTTFNNSLSSEFISFTSSGTALRYLSVPQNAFLTRGSINLTYPSASSLKLYYDFNSSRERVSGVYNLTGGTGIYNNSNCRIDGCIQLNGSQSFVKSLKIPPSPEIDLGSGNKTINFWFRITNANERGPVILVRGHTQAGHGYTYIGDNVNRRFYTSNSFTGATVNAGTFYNDTYYMFTYTVNSSQYGKVYLNGTLIGQGQGLMVSNLTANITLGQIMDTSDCSPGGGGVGCRMTGQIDELGVWNATLSQAQITALYNSGNGLDFGSSFSLNSESGSSGNISFDIGTTGITDIVVSNISQLNSSSTSSGLQTSINNYLNSCSFVGGYCLVPFNFTSNIGGVWLLYNMLNFSNEGFTENSQTFDATTIDISEENYKLNLSFDSNRYTAISGNLIYNGTTYVASASGVGNERIFSVDLQVPPVLVTTNISFYWQIFMTDTSGQSIFNSTFQNQTVNPISLFHCITGTRAINLTTYDEETNLLLNTTFEGTFNYSNKNLSISSSQNNTVSICISSNNTITTNIDISLSAAGYTSRTFFYQDLSISNTTTHARLYLLNSSLGTDFKIIVKDTGLVPLENYNVKIYRKLEGTGEQILVENDRTDFLGQMVVRLIENDVTYKVEIYNTDNTLIKTIENAIAVCYAAICTQQYIISDTTDVFSDFDSIDEYSGVLDYDNNTRTFTLAWVDNNDFSSTHRLEITKYLFNGSVVVYNQTSTDNSGSLSYSVSNERASYSAQAFRRTNNRDQRIGVINIKVGDLTSTFGLEGLIWSFFLLMTLILIGAFYPPAAIVLYLTGIFLLSIFDVVYLNPAILIGQAVVGVLFIWAFRG